jgi:putative toxin-antitoxin system antitoxin component (TIGR02293 family)
MANSKSARAGRARTAAAVTKEPDLVPSVPLMPANDVLPAPAVRAQPGALESLFRLGYAQDEIFALVVPKRTLARRQAAGELLTVEETDKAMRLERIAVQAERVFGDAEKAHRWLRKPKRALKGETPLAYLASEAGARVVEEMLHRIDHGMFA